MPRKTKIRLLEQEIGELKHFIKNSPYRQIIIARDEIRDYLCPKCHKKIDDHVICEYIGCVQLICPDNIPETTRNIFCVEHEKISKEGWHLKENNSTTST